MATLQSKLSGFIEGRPRRRYGVARWRWVIASSDARLFGAHDAKGNPVPHPMTRPYLLVHPEREIAEVRYVGHYAGAFCSACDRWIAAPATMHAPADYPYLEARVHNARIHPRRAARLTQ